MKSLIILLFTSLFLTSCANYMSSMHKEFDKYDRTQEGYKPSSNPNMDMIRNNRRNPRNNLNTTQLINSQTNPDMPPKVKRQYMSPYKVKKRYKVDDLNDNGSDGSLWASSEKNKVNYLFTKNDKKQNGDIVLINVYQKLKNDITAELKRAFPPAPAPQSKKAEKPAAGAATADAPKKEDEEETGADKVYDRLSSVIIEEINQDHVLVRGRKNLLYQNRKRLIEVQALVSRRDISDTDTINSNKILESSVQVIR